MLPAPQNVPPQLRFERIAPGGNGPAFQVDAEPRDDGPRFEVNEGDEFGNYPAPWIWQLIQGQRERVVRISYKPVERNHGGVDIQKWTMNDGKQCISLEVDWRITYLDANGVEVSEPPVGQPARRLPVYTRIPYPDLTDPKKEVEAMNRVDLVTRAYCYPVVASMDPTQKDQQLWDNVSDVVATKVFVDYHKENDPDVDPKKAPKIGILYGEKHDKNYNLPQQIESHRNLIYTGTRFGLGPVVSESQAGKRLMQINSKFAPLIEPPIFGEHSIALRDLQELPPDQISTGMIRNRNIQPKDYIKRLKNEIEEELAACEEARKTFIMDLSGKQPVLSKSYRKFLKSVSGSSGVSSLLSRLGLGRFTKKNKESYRTQRRVLVERFQAAKTAYRTKVAEAASLPANDPAVEQQRAQLEAEKQQLRAVQINSKKALGELEATLNKGRAEFEGAIALVETLEKQAKNKQDQLKKLLHASEADGGFDLNGAPNSDISQAEKAEWIATLAKNETALAHNATCLRLAVKGLTGAGMSFDRDKEKISAANFGQSLANIGERVEALTLRSEQRRGEAETTLEAFLADPEGATTHRAHVDALDKLHRLANEIMSLVTQIDADANTLDQLVHRPEVSEADRDSLDQTRENLVAYNAQLQQLRSNVSVWIRDMTIPPPQRQ